jgi:CubicO group peptidase (beta-lactamase class C family)
MSARTLSVYLQMFLSNGSNILHPRSIAEMRIVVGGGLIPPYNQGLAGNSSGQRLPSQFGLAWYWYTMSNGRRYIGHTGAIPGVIHLMLANEKNNLGVIVLTNGDASEPTDLSREIIETVEKIHMSLFECFDTDLAHASAFRTKGTLVGYFSAIFIVFCTFG